MTSLVDTPLLSSISMPLGGATIDETFATKAFYGLRYNILTGRLTIDEIANSEDTIILPNDYTKRPDDYKQWIWAKTKLSFALTSSGHLLLTIL